MAKTNLRHVAKKTGFNDLKKQHEDVFKNKNIEAVGNWMQPMTIAEKASKVFDSGLAFRIWNKPVKDPKIEEGLWDMKIFWEHMEYNGKDVVATCDAKGFQDLDDCLNDCIKYIENFEDNK